MAQELFISANLDGICQCVKITPLKKITAEEVEFFDGDEKLDIDARLAAFMKDKHILIEGKRLHMAGNNNRQLLWLGSSEKTADVLFNALEAFSKKSKINFLVNYHCAQEEEVNDEKKPVLTFHPEVIIDGYRLINDFPDIDLNRRFVVLGEWKVQDITYSKYNSVKEPVTFDDASCLVCEKTLESLDNFFNVDYRVSLIYGTIKNEYTGLAPDVRKAIEEVF